MSLRDIQKTGCTLPVSLLALLLLTAVSDKMFLNQGAGRISVNRKQFIQSRGATCRNWTWSWSFINHDEQFVIFGAWDTEREKERAVILREEWEFSASHKKQPGYTQAIEHIGFILQGYELFTFNMVHAPNPDNPDVAVIKDFERRLDHRFLRKEETVWYADFTANTFPDELPVSGNYIEGAKKSITVNAYERDPLKPGGPVLATTEPCAGAVDSISKKRMASTGKDSFTSIMSGH
ncbi:hypothetical protein [Salmonella enterica]|uniref:hypothetical protein n=1 Tax=Salmonella enterica TaxID=28901 RepID=UPI0020CAB6C1|nr:hypothetical protein [Salmonella enterica]